MIHFMGRKFHFIRQQFSSWDLADAKLNALTIVTRFVFEYSSAEATAGKKSREIISVQRLASPRAPI